MAGRAVRPFRVGESQNATAFPLPIAIPGLPRPLRSNLQVHIVLPSCQIPRYLILQRLEGKLELQFYAILPKIGGIGSSWVSGNLQGLTGQRGKGPMGQE